MALLFPALALTFGLADGRRVQHVPPIDRIIRKAHSSRSTGSIPLSIDDSPASFESEMGNYDNQSFVDSPKAQIEKLSLRSPQNRADLQWHPRIWITNKAAAGHSLIEEQQINHSGLSRQTLGCLTGACLAALMCICCCLANRPASYCPPSGPRNQYIHNSRLVYEWDQSPKSATIYIKPPKGIKRNDLDIKIDARNLRVGRKGKPSFLREEIYDLVNEELSSWTLRSNGELHIVLHKVRRGEWPTILVHNDKTGGLDLRCSTTPHVPS